VERRNRVWRRLHNDELYGLYSLPDFIQLIKSVRMIWVGRVAGMGDGKDACRGLMADLSVRGKLE
jgi:hypothetical protein